MLLLCSCTCSVSQADEHNLSVEGQSVQYLTINVCWPPAHSLIPRPSHSSICCLQCYCGEGLETRLPIRSHTPLSITISSPGHLCSSFPIYSLIPRSFLQPHSCIPTASFLPFLQPHSNAIPTASFLPFLEPHSNAIPTASFLTFLQPNSNAIPTASFLDYSYSLIRSPFLQPHS